jgi:integrase
MAVKQRKRSPYDPYKITVKGKVRWQVSLPGTYRKKEDGKRVRVRPRRTFSNAEEAHTFALLKRRERENYGLSAVSMDETLRGDALAAQRVLAPYNVSILTAAEYYAQHMRQLQKSETVSGAVKALLKGKEADNLRRSYINDLRVRLTRFSSEFGDRLLADIEPAEIESWLRSLSLAPLGRNTYRLRLNTLFEYGRKCGWVAVNPVEHVAKAKVREALPGILTPEQTARLLEAATEQTLPYWAISFFGGLRSAELERLRWEDIDFASQLITVPSASSKTGSRRFVRISENLLQWLAPYQSDRRLRGPVCPLGLRKLLEADRRTAGITKWPPNACRHSYGSYHLSHYKNAANTALQMGHVNSAMLFRFYHQRVKPAEAKKFWRIAPAVQAERNLTSCCLGLGGE